MLALPGTPDRLGVWRGFRALCVLQDTPAAHLTSPAARPAVYQPCAHPVAQPLCWSVPRDRASKPVGEVGGCSGEHLVFREGRGDWDSP